MTIYVVYLTVYSGNKLPPFYIGSSSLEKIQNGYKGSVTSKKYKQKWKNEVKTNPEQFKTNIISRHKTRKEALSKEYVLQKKLNVVKSEMYVNMAIAAPFGFFGMDVSGKNAPFYGKKHTEETKNIIREKRKQQNQSKESYKERGRKISAKMKGNKNGFGKKKPQHLIDKMSKKWIVIEPDGTSVFVKNLNIYVKEKNLSYEGLRSSPMNKRNKTYKGYKLIRVGE